MLCGEFPGPAVDRPASTSSATFDPDTLAAISRRRAAQIDFILEFYASETPVTVREHSLANRDFETPRIEGPETFDSTTEFRHAGIFVAK